MQEYEIIERIKALCQTRFWTYYQLAKESGIAYSTLHTMLHKANTPSLPTLIKICDGFGITLAEFFDKDNDIAFLSDAQKFHLSQWNHLTDENKGIAEKYIDFLISQQQ